MTIVAIIVAAAILTMNIMRFSSYVDSDIEAHLTRSLLEIQKEIELLETKAAYLSALYFVSDKIIIESMESGNRELLRERAAELMAQTGIDICAITDASGIVIAQPHAPELYGDDISAMPGIRRALSGTIFMTTMYGLTADMAASASAPIFNDDGTLFGAIVVGFRIDTEEFVLSHKELTGAEITVYREDQRVATTFLNPDGTPGIGSRADESISRIVLAGSTFLGQTKILDTDTITKYAPILNPEGKGIGMLLAGYSLKEKTNTIRGFLRTGLISTIIILAISIIFIIFIVDWIIVPINKLLDKIHYDSLTGVYNRRYFDENINRLIKTLSRSNSKLSLLMLDIDYFKKYNDTYGHTMGDECLKTATSALSRGIKRADDFIARYGGEEFVIVLPNTDNEGACIIANKMIELIRNCKIPHEKSEISGYVTVSIGVTTGQALQMHSGDDYIKKADEMLYKSKEEGRNRYNFSPL